MKNVIFLLFTLLQIGQVIAQNVGIGTTSPQALLDVNGNALIYGVRAGRGAGNIASNTVFGSSGLNSNTSGYRNTANGYYSLFNNTTGSFNSALGSFSLLNNTTGSFNTVIGDDALSHNTTGQENSAIGYGTLYNNTIGSFNSAIGAVAGWENVTGSKNTFIGDHANPASGDLQNATAIGCNAMVGASNSMVLGSINGVNGANSNTNVGIGTSTPAARLDVAADILINGVKAGRGSGNLEHNTVFGNLALNQNTDGNRNIAVGYGTLAQNSTGSFNISIGSFSLWNNSTGNSNTSIGDDATNSNTSGYRNSSLGHGALYSNTTGSFNSAFGVVAGYNNVTGWGNTFIGDNANPSSGDFQNATAIGCNAMVGASNALVLGSINGVNGASANTNVGIGTTTPTARLEVAGTFKASAWKTCAMSANGYAEMGGVLIQWGVVSYNSNSTQTINFPTPFAQVYSVTATVDAGNNTGSGANVPVKTASIGNVTFQVAGTQVFSGDNASVIRWMAIGQ